MRAYDSAIDAAVHQQAPGEQAQLPEPRRSSSIASGAGLMSGSHGRRERRLLSEMPCVRQGRECSAARPFWQASRVSKGVNMCCAGVSAARSHELLFMVASGLQGIYASSVA